MSASQALNSLQDLYRQLKHTVNEMDSRYRSAIQTPIQDWIMDLDLSDGCKYTTATYVINHNNVGTPPSSATCETGTEALEVPDFRTVHIYCSIDNSGGETNPIVTTLNVFSGEANCLCSLVALNTPTRSIPCTLNIKRCPKIVGLNLTRSQLT